MWTQYILHSIHPTIPMTIIRQIISYLAPNKATITSSPRASILTTKQNKTPAAYHLSPLFTCLLSTRSIDRVFSLPLFMTLQLHQLIKFTRIQRGRSISASATTIEYFLYFGLCCPWRRFVDNFKKSSGLDPRGILVEDFSPSSRKTPCSVLSDEKSGLFYLCFENTRQVTFFFQLTDAHTQKPPARVFLLLFSS